MEINKKNKNFMNSYSKIVEELESGSKPYAKKSFESFSSEFLGGGNMEEFYCSQWEDSLKKARISRRTPLQIERDRILYSDGMRKLNEKNHILFSGNQKVVRNYTTHTMRMAQVSRAICRALGLNEDFAEAIALGSKIGALPFVHVSKREISKWIEKRIMELDKEATKGKVAEKQMALFNSKLEIPSWLDNVNSEDISKDIKQFLPWASGNKNEQSYTSGKQGYWMLSTNPYLVEPINSYYSPEIMYGIWCHSIDSHENQKFHHTLEFPNLTKFEISSEKHSSLEAMVVQYADDITWVIENINDSNQASLMNDDTDIYKDLHKWLNDDALFPSALSEGIARSNPGLFYTYFIDNFITHSERVLSNALKGEQVNREILMKENVKIGLSEEANYGLNKLKSYLKEAVFGTAKIENRNKMLGTISEATLDILWEDRRDTLTDTLKQISKRRGWDKNKEKKVLEFTDKKVHKVQLVVDIFSEMSDIEVFGFIGIGAF